MSREEHLDSERGSSATPCVAYFGPFDFDTVACRLSRDGVEVHLTPKAAAVLSHLLQHPGELISKDEFLETVWEGVHVREESLTQAISVIRQTLGDSAQSPQYIQTLSGEGYRFVGEVVYRGQIDSAAESDPEESVDRPKEGLDDHHRRGAPAPAWLRPVTVGAGAVVLLALLALGSGWVVAPAETSTADPVADDVPLWVPLTFDGGMKSNPALSPDGNFVAFDWTTPEGDNPDIWVLQIGAGTEARPVTDDPATDRGPVWSPDGQKIAFVRIIDNRATIYSVPSLGGEERKLVDVQGPYDLVQYPRFVTLSWSSQGLLAYSERPTDDDPARIMILDASADEGGARVLTPPPPPTGERIIGDIRPSFSPDGRQVAFVRSPSFYGGYDVWVVGVDGGEPRRVTSRSWRYVHSITWTADGSELLFSAGSEATEWTYRVAAEGGEPRPVEGLADNDLSPDIVDTRMVYRSVSTPHREIWAGPGRLADDPEAPPRRLIGRGYSHNADFSPDGRQIVLRSSRTGSSQIWIAERDGFKLRQLTELEFTTNAPTWSPDGRQIAFFGGPTSPWDIFIVDVETRRVRQVTSDPADDFGPVFSFAGDWLYFTSDRDGIQQIYRLPADGNDEDQDPVQVTRGGGYYGMEHIDGYFYFTRELEAKTVWRILVGGGEETEVVTLPVNFGFGDVDLAEAGLYYGSRFLPGLAGERGPLVEDYIADTVGLSDPGFTYRISYRDFETGHTTDLFEGPGWFTWLRVSPDERTVLISVDGGAVESELVLVDNFR